MRVLSYEDLLNRAIRKCGFVAEDFAAEERVVLNGALDEALRFGYEFYQWPELVQVTEVFLKQVNADSLSEDRAVDDWQLDASGRLVPLSEQSAEEDNRTEGLWYLRGAERFFGTIERVYNVDPLGVQVRPRGLRWQWRDGLLCVLGVDGQDALWVEHRAREPGVEGAPWDAERAYAVDERVLWPELALAEGGEQKQEVYLCVSETAAGEDPESAAAKWVQVPIPFFLGDFAADYARGAWLQQDGQGSKGDQLEAKAANWLYHQVDRVEGQTGRGRFY